MSFNVDHCDILCPGVSAWQASSCELHSRFREVSGNDIHTRTLASQISVWDGTGFGKCVFLGGQTDCEKTRYSYTRFSHCKSGNVELQIGSFTSGVTQEKKSTRPHSTICDMNHITAHYQDNLADWSKALASGANPQGRGFETHIVTLGAIPLPAMTISICSSQTWV